MFISWYIQNSAPWNFHIYTSLNQTYFVLIKCLFCNYVSYKPLQFLALFSQFVCLGCLNCRSACPCVFVEDMFQYAMENRVMIKPWHGNAFLIADAVLREKPTNRGSSSKKASNAERKKRWRYDALVTVFFLSLFIPKVLPVHSATLYEIGESNLTWPKPILSYLALSCPVLSYLVLSYLPTVSTAYPTGSPLSVCSYLYVKHGLPPQTSPTPYVVMVNATEYSPGDIIPSEYISMG